MSADITEWLENLNLGRYAEAFTRNDVDLRSLPILTEQDFKDLGVSLGHRRILGEAIARLPAESIPATAEGAHAPDDDNVSVWDRRPDERKPATVLFADITGSTALTEYLDSEDAHELLHGARRRMLTAVTRNRGTVCRVMGDGIMAVFGAPIASEQHALDACSAALEMQDSIGEYAASLVSEHGHGLQIRVGLHSGEIVVLSSSARDPTEYDADGPTVPIAARMEQSAAPGDVYITDATRALAENRVEVEQLPPISLKGITEPVATFVLRRVLAPDEAPFKSSRTPFVGRLSELNQFRGIWDACVEQGYGQTIYVRGEPGIGKTRLVDEFTTIATGTGAALFRSLVLPFGVGSGQDAIRALVRALLGIDPTGDGSRRKDALDAAIAANRVQPEQMVFFNDLLNLPQPRELRIVYDAMSNDARNDGKRTALTSLLSAECVHHPLLIVIEDVHWADSITLAYLAAISNAVSICRALLVVTSRIDGDQLNQDWRSNATQAMVSIDLGPLRDNDAEELVAQYVNPEDAMATTCLQRAAGNPLFLEQLLRNIVHGDVNHLPDSIQSVALARMDRLAPREKRALQSASVIGQLFELNLLRHLMEDDTYECRNLVDRNLVRTVAGGFLFAHALIQESIYRSLVKSERCRLHARIADWFANSDPVLHAQHLDRAEHDGATAAYLAAARIEAAHYRFEKAMTLLERGLALDQHDERFALLIAHGDLLRNLVKIDESIATFRTAKSIASTDAQRCIAAVGIAEGLRITDCHDELLEELRVTEELAHRGAMTQQLSSIHKLRGGVQFIRGETDAGMSSAEKALDFAQRSGSPELEAQALSNLGDAEYNRGRMMTANRHYLRCIELANKHGLGRIVAANLSMLGITWAYLGDSEQAESNFRSALELGARVRQARVEMIALAGGQMLADAGKLQEAERWFRTLIDRAEGLGSHIFKASGLGHLAMVMWIRNDWAEARQLLDECMELLRQAKALKFMAPRMLALRAVVSEDSAARESSLKEGLALLEQSAVGHNYLWFYRHAIEATLIANEWDAADRYAEALEKYTEAEPLPWSNFFVARGRTLASIGRGEPCSSTISDLTGLRDDAYRMGFHVSASALEDAIARYRPTQS